MRGNEVRPARFSACHLDDLDEVAAGVGCIPPWLEVTCGGDWTGAFAVRDVGALVYYLTALPCRKASERCGGLPGTRLRCARSARSLPSHVVLNGNIAC